MMKKTSDFLAENAVPLTLVGLSAGWLALAFGRQRLAQRGRGDAREVVAEYPLVVGTLAAATGVGIAMALPETQLENRVVSPVARGLAERTRELADHVRADLQSARDAAGALRDSLTQPSEPSEADA
jgi:hypothetical protein